uniref:Methyltransferase n=1 Tax=Cucumis melo TaxID=3656 RepID=A0A9I9DU47_CUCME
MYRDVSSCNTYNYGDAVYWDARYLHEAGSFDWYQRYSSLRPFVRKFISTSASVLMVGCGNAVMSEDMVKDGYEDIMNVDISSFALCVDLSMLVPPRFTPGLLILGIGTLDSLMCGTDAPISAAQMLGEITYGDPKVRMPHLMRPSYNWKIALSLVDTARPGYQRPEECSTPEKSYLEPVPLTENGLLSPNFVMEDPDSHFIYVCQKLDDSDPNNIVPPYLLSTDAL